MIHLDFFFFKWLSGVGWRKIVEGKDKRQETVGSYCNSPCQVVTVAQTGRLQQNWRVAVPSGFNLKVESHGDSWWTGGG